MANPLTDELSDESKAWLAAKFRELRCYYPPVCYTPIGYTMRLLRQRRDL